MAATEANPSPSTAPSAAFPSWYRQQLLEQREQSKMSPGRSLRQRRSPTLGQGVGKNGISGSIKEVRTSKSRLRLSPNASPRATQLPKEAKSQEDTRLQRPRKASLGEDNFEIAPDGGSAGREGRQFTVANVGNNGRIYLKPTVRPANQRYPQPQFVFPVTPPSTAGLDVLTEKESKYPEITSADMHESVWTPSQGPPTPFATRDDPKRMPHRPVHRRAVSDSTIPDTSAARESDAGGFKIVITQPGEDQRPKTVEDLGNPNGPLLQISIPSWRLGTPRFSVRGTPFIRGSSYAPTEEFRSSRVSMLHRSLHDRSSDMAKRPPPTTLPRFASNGSGSQSLISPRLPPPLRSTYMPAHPTIEPAMFDSLTFRPACDDRAIVRYSAATGAVTAATPPRLVAEITSPSFLDYELLSDFFLTFRFFLEPHALLRMLISRLRWALERDDEAGMIVRVRTFVAIRHWILNYFVDDFVADYQLRVVFCDLLNGTVRELSQDLNGRKVQLKILAELKKCWRRVCAQFWDGPQFDAALGPDIPVVPGGIAGYRDPNLDPTHWEDSSASPPQLDYIVPQARGETSFYIDVAKAGNIDSVIVGNRPATPDNQTDEAEDWDRAQASPTSVTSVEVLSCSFPSKNMRFAQPTSRHPLAAHPVDPSSIYNSSDPVAVTPRALAGKRVRPRPAHKRNGSTTDSLREHATVAEKDLQKNTDALLTLPYAGSLVRGNLLPPSAAFVEVPRVSGGPSRETTVFQSQPSLAEREKYGASAMSGQGMRRLLGGVRRALSTRGAAMLSTSDNIISISPIGPRGATTNRLPGTAIVPQARPPRQDGIRPPVRIDLLGAEVAEDFKKAVREEAAAEAEKNNGYLSPPASGSRVPGDLLEYSAAHMDTIVSENPQPPSETNMTSGSKSIMIVDGTAPASADLPVMTGALSIVNPSVEAFADSFLPMTTDPTPPNTPPGQGSGTPRRSSYILSQVMPNRQSELIPPLPNIDFAAYSPSSPALPRFSEDVSRPSVDLVQHNRSRPPLSRGRGHIRNHSSRSFYSSRSGRPRHHSFAYSLRQPPTIRSFDATTYSEGSVADVSDVPMPQPLRVLRRRPGGDLRAVINIGELDSAGLRRSRSLGSLTTYSDSMHSSIIRSPAAGTDGFVDVVNSDYSQRGDTFSLGAIAEKPKRNVSLFSTHSSKPVMRPSFEAEAKKLAQIPDDMDDDGGVESALLKLEGRYEKRIPRLSMERLPGSPLKKDITISAEKAGSVSSTDNSTKKAERKEHRHAHVAEDLELAPPTIQLPETPAHGSFLAIPTGARQSGDVQSFLSEASDLSYSSTPILDRGLEDAREARATGEWTNQSVLFPDDDMATPSDVITPEDSLHSSYDLVKQRHVSTHGAETQQKNSADHSFLDVDSDHDSDLSSEFSADLDEDEFAAFPLPKQGTTSRWPVHPLGDNPTDGRQSRQGTNPPSPPMTLVQALQMTPDNYVMIPVLEEHQLDPKASPLTPDATPTTTKVPTFENVSAAAADPTGTQEALWNAPTLDMADPVGEAAAAPVQSAKFSVHLPFILAFDSDVLAQQFTLIEKDALNEIDWKELIEMRWKDAEANGVNARSWVTFLRDTDARGVEVVIARFNIMVKWAISEIVLTKNLEERARCLIKYIHIAAHCRRYRNFATMSQLTIALTSNEICRLSKTWAMVPVHDARTLRELETLISPTRNFYNLRAEMEGGVTTSAAAATGGCIPFVGIYTHDLLFNAQRPSEIASSPTTAPLVNFERCRTAAGVVKTLLRLLEASTLYKFQPIEGITERCLWMGALTDEEIRRCSEALE